jgi:hypothetical protein
MRLSLLALVAYGCGTGPPEGKQGGQSAPGPTSATSGTPPTTTSTTPTTPTTPTTTPTATTSTTSWTGPTLHSLTALDNPDFVLQKTLTAEVSPAAPIDLVCEAPGVEGERHVLHSATAETHEFVVHGLLGDTEYSCVASWPEEPARVQLELTTLTGPLPDGVPTLSAEVLLTDRMTGIYTLFNHFDVGNNRASQKVYVVDPEGRIRWYHDPVFNAGIGLEPVVLDPGRVLIGGAMPAVFLTLSQQTLWEAAPPTDAGTSEWSGEFHHETGLTPDGQVIVLYANENTFEGHLWEGFVIEFRSPYTDAVTWSWNSQDAVDEGVLPPAVREDEDVYHANAVVYVEDEDGPALYLSLWRLDQLARIDIASGEISWFLGFGGDFELVDEAGAPLDDSEWFWGPHGHDVRGSRILFHDNGRRRPVDPDDRYSRALELEIDVAARTARKVWEYREQGWYERLWGDADLLDGGHVLIGMAHNPQEEYPVDASRRTAIVEVDPTTDEVVHRLAFPDEDDSIYRASRLDGCALFAHAGYCASL